MIESLIGEVEAMVRSENTDVCETETDVVIIIKLLRMKCDICHVYGVLKLAVDVQGAEAQRLVPARQQVAPRALRPLDGRAGGIGAASVGEVHVPLGARPAESQVGQVVFIRVALNEPTIGSSSQTEF